MPKILHFSVTYESYLIYPVSEYSQKSLILIKYYVFIEMRIQLYKSKSKDLMGRKVSYFSEKKIFLTFTLNSSSMQIKNHKPMFVKAQSLNHKPLPHCSSVLKRLSVPYYSCNFSTTLIRTLYA